MLKRDLKKTVVALLLICAMACSLTACAIKLKGTYVSDGIIEQRLTFQDDNVVVISAFGIDAQGTYKIEDDKITITYKLLNLSYDWEKSFEKNGETIIIDGTEFVKEK